MDILNVSFKEIDNMEFSDYLRAVRYSWTAFNVRRMDLPFRKGDDDEEDETKDVLVFDQSHLLKQKVEQMKCRNEEKKLKGT